MLRKENSRIEQTKQEGLKTQQLLERALGKFTAARPPKPTKVTVEPTKKDQTFVFLPSFSNQIPIEIKQAQEIVSPDAKRQVEEQAGRPFANGNKLNSIQSKQSRRYLTPKQTHEKIRSRYGTLVQLVSDDRELFFETNENKQAGSSTGSP